MCKGRGGREDDRNWIRIINWSYVFLYKYLLYVMVTSLKNIHINTGDLERETDRQTNRQAD